MLLRERFGLLRPVPILVVEAHPVAVEQVEAIDHPLEIPSQRSTSLASRCRTMRFPRSPLQGMQESPLLPPSPLAFSRPRSTHAGADKVQRAPPRNLRVGVALIQSLCCP